MGLTFGWGFLDFGIEVGEYGITSSSIPSTLSWQEVDKPAPAFPTLARKESDRVVPEEPQVLSSYSDFSWEGRQSGNRVNIYTLYSLQFWWTKSNKEN